MRQVVLHGLSLCLHWISALLVIKVVKLCDYSAERAVLAAVLFVLFPFNFVAIPWVTAVSHPLVTMLTLLAVYSALRAERDRALRWRSTSILATLLAPFAHESGAVAGLIVAGTVMFQFPFKPTRRALRTHRWRILALGLGVLCNAATVWLRPQIPGVGTTALVGLDQWLGNGMFFLHGLLYPVAPIVGWLVQHTGWNDFTLIALATLLLALVLLGLLLRTRDWRWAGRSLWWWACASLPAALSLEYSYLYISPRVHSLASVGVAMLWAGLIIELGKTLRHTTGRHLASGVLAGAIVLQNGAFLVQRHSLFEILNGVYRQALQAAAAPGSAPLGFVNVPAWLAYPHKTYAMVTESVVFLPPYSNIGEFIEVNQAWRAADGVMFTPVLRETEHAFGFRGEGLDWESMRRFAVDHRSVWLAVYEDERFVLRHVGSVVTDAIPASGPLVRFQGGPVIESVAPHRAGEDVWALAFTWWAPGPVNGEIFVHVRDTAGDLVAQVDGPGLGGTVPVWLWQPADRIYDIRYVRLPDAGAPYTVHVGVYNDQGRFPALIQGVRAPGDAAPVATIPPAGG
jgi:hypothetical protein